MRRSAERIIDAQGNVARIEYNELGRRTLIENPDTGRVTFEWDLAGNVVKKVTPTLRASGQAILYGYRFNRLERITYPSHPDDNVSYEYGGPDLAGQPGNRAGRITRVTDRSGIEERFCGRPRRLHDDVPVRHLGCMLAECPPKMWFEPSARCATG